MTQENVLVCRIMDPAYGQCSQLGFSGVVFVDSFATRSVSVLRLRCKRGLLILINLAACPSTEQSKLRLSYYKPCPSSENTNRFGYRWDDKFHSFCRYKKPWEAGFPGPRHELKHPVDASRWAFSLQPPVRLLALFIWRTGRTLRQRRDHMHGSGTEVQIQIQVNATARSCCSSCRFAPRRRGRDSFRP